MATGRKMDKHLDIISEYQMLTAQSSEARKILTAIDERRKILLSQILHTMQKSKVGLIENEPYFEVLPTSRRTVTVDRVIEVCPERLDELVTIHDGHKLKFFK